MVELALQPQAELGFVPYRAETTVAEMYPPRHDAKTLVRRLGLTNSFDYYRRLVDWLAGSPVCAVRQMRYLHAPAPPDRVVVGLRHDMDTEPYSSVEVAWALCEAGLPGSFYVLHTAEYYGQWIDDVFLRNGAIAPMLRQIRDFGCEVGLHNDALWVYRTYGADGAQAITDELEWLRTEGLQIDGTAAHGCAPVYGAENFEIFQGRAVLNRSGVPFGDRTIPLQTLRESILGISYEANFPIPARRHTRKLQRFLSGLPDDAVRDPRWMRTYLADNPHSQFGDHYNAWLIGNDRWAIGKRRPWRSLFVWNATFDDLRAFLSRVGAGRRVVCHVHPVYIELPDMSS